MPGGAVVPFEVRQPAMGFGARDAIASLLVTPNLDAANIAFNLLNAATEGLTIDPILLGLSKPINVMVPNVTARGIVKLSALSVRTVQGFARKAVAA